MVQETQTEHAHIVRHPEICGGAPTIKGTRISVSHIALLWKAGDAVEEIVRSYPHLKPSQVYDAISYYLDHQEEIEQEIQSNRIDTVTAAHALECDAQGILRPRK